MQTTQKSPSFANFFDELLLWSTDGMSSNKKHILTQRSCIRVSTDFQKVIPSTCSEKHQFAKLGDLAKLGP
jgi:hypothetical protein